MDICSTPINGRIDKPEEACGVFGIVTPGKAVGKIAYYGIFALQHRGQESAGIAAYNHNYLNTHRGMGLVSQVFTEEKLSKLNGQIALAHTRYSTTGSSTLCNAQPIVINTRQGMLTLAHNGNLVNTIELREEALKENIQINASSDSEIMAQLMAAMVDKGHTLETAIKETLKKCVGSYCVIISTGSSLFAARDPYGIRPLSLGQTPDGDIVVASETCSLDIVGAKRIKDIEPGEIVEITLNRELKSQFLTDKRKEKLCIFEFIYFARPDSLLHGESVNKYRFNLGRELSKVQPVQADIVISVPDSGTTAAIGYAYESKIPFSEGLIKNRYVGRTFITPTQEIRERGIRTKLNPITDILKGKRVVVVDDSIVRGNTIKQLVDLLKHAGAKEVHLRISSAPIKHPCFYGIDIDSHTQLIAANKSLQEITDLVKADSLQYLPFESMCKVCDPNNLHRLCTACFNGQYPIDFSKFDRINKLILERGAIAVK